MALFQSGQSPDSEATEPKPASSQSWIPASWKPSCSIHTSDSKLLNQNFYILVTGTAQSRVSMALMGRLPAAHGVQLVLQSRMSKSWPENLKILVYEKNLFGDPWSMSYPDYFTFLSLAESRVHWLITLIAGTPSIKHDATWLDFIIKQSIASIQVCWALQQLGGCD